MGSGDLNMKKSWHPQRSGNLAATAKAEAEAIAERKKLQQRLHEIEEERRKEEIQKALEAAGGKRKIDRVEWMYTGGPGDQAGDSAENEAYLLGKRRIDKLLQDNEVKKLQKQTTLEKVSEAPAVANARDVAAKIREDPLLAIKRQEQQAYEAMMNDPIKRRQLLASMGIDDSAQKSKHKEERRHKHRHHHRSRRHRDDYRDGERPSRSRSPRDDDDQRLRRRRDSADRRQSRSRSPNGDYNKRRRRRRDSPDRRQSRSRSPRDYDNQRRRRRRRDSPDRTESRSRSPREDDNQRRRRRDSPERRQSRSRSPRDDDDQRRRRRDSPDRRYKSTGSNRPHKEETGGHNDRWSARNNHAISKEQADNERARKLAAMQEAATDLDEARKLRLAAIEEAERKAQEEEDRVRQRNKKFGGNARFTNNLHSRAADMKVSERLGR